MESEDLLVEIFHYLPVKSLTRCKCLSKKWNRFISYDNSFRQTYLSRFQGEGSCPIMLGFFYHRDRVYHVPHQVMFTSTSTQGNTLISGDYTAQWGAPPLPQSFDESLRFIGHETIYIVACSNGFILCCLEEYDPMSYYMCNPITKEWVALPKPSMTSAYVPTGFICQGNYPCLKLVNYKVVRGIWPNPRVFTNILTIEMFSSEAFEWKVMNMMCDSPFHLDLSNPSSVIINDEGVVHWLAVTEALSRSVVVFDQRKERLQLVVLPGEDRGRDCFSHSDGCVLYVGFNLHRLELEIWKLEKSDNSGKEWSLLFKVEEMPTEIYPQGLNTDTFTIISVHPLNPLVLFITFGIGHKIIMYDVKNSKMEFVCDLTSVGWRSGYFFFAYVWPNWPPFFPSS